MTVSLPANFTIETARENGIDSFCEQLEAVSFERLSARDALALAPALYSLGTAVADAMRSEVTDGECTEIDEMVQSLWMPLPLKLQGIRGVCQNRAWLIVRTARRLGSIA